MTRHQSIQLDESDTVVTVLEDTTAGNTVETNRGDVELVESVAFGHKVAIDDLAPGDEIRKYGEVIGVATERIVQGEWVHVHNCDSVRGKAEGRQ
ncbi:UxaA family hydrolase [Halosolutus halophilus]|uniref:UxaA family hydrolase n=1 Tax=Halosolutus halophilus TaxID=1552990 RepID=UPI0022352C76|nr:UxaA family hydrolase [Halosolutus halophilus]